MYWSGSQRNKVVIKSTTVITTIRDWGGYVHMVNCLVKTPCTEIFHPRKIPGKATHEKVGGALGRGKW